MVTFNKDFDLEHILGGFKLCKLGNIARELTTEKLSKENRNKKEHEFIQEFERKHKSNNGWNYSNFDSYIEGIPISKQFFFDEYENATEQEFYIHELKCIEENTITDTNPKVYYYDVCLNDILPENILNRVMYSQKRKIEFLQKLIGNNNNENSEIPPKLTIKHKITLLHELGIIEHIRKRQKFGLSTNQIAKVIALLLSEGVGTIQSDLSALENKNKDKTPLKKNNIQKIHDYLINIGFSNDSFETKTPL